MNFREVYWQHFLHGNFTDLEITINDGETDHSFKCHKIILSSAGGFFGSMYDCEMLESYSDSFRISQKVSKQIFTKILLYIYTERTEKIDAAHLLELLFCASYFQLPGLEKAVEDDINSLTTTDEIADLIKSLTKSNAIDLPSKLIENIVMNFNTLRVLDEMMMLPYSSIISIIQNPKLRVKEEAMILDFIIKYKNNKQLSESKLRAMGDCILWENIGTEKLENIGMSEIEALIDEETLQQKTREFEDRIVVFPDNAMFALLVTQSSINSAQDFCKRYTSASNMMFSFEVNPENCEKYHIWLNDWPENGVFERRNFSFSLGFDEGYVGAFFSVKMNFHPINTCQVMHIHPNTPKGELHHKIELSAKENIIIREDLMCGSLMDKVRFSVTGEKKPHGKIENFVIMGCITIKRL